MGSKLTTVATELDPAPVVLTDTSPVEDHTAMLAILGPDWELVTDFSKFRQGYYETFSFKCLLSGLKANADPKNKRELRRQFPDYEILEYKVGGYGTIISASYKH